MAVSQKHVWSDIDPDFVQDGTGRIKIVEDVLAVQASIDNILRTSPGERCYLPQFGSSLQGLLFENITPTFSKMISRMIKDAIETWDDRVSIQEVGIRTDPDAGQVYISVSFSIKNYGNVFQHQITI